MARDAERLRTDPVEGIVADLDTHRPPDAGLHPDDVHGLDVEYDIRIDVSRDRVDGMDVTVVRRSLADHQLRFESDSQVRGPLTSYTNHPVRRVPAGGDFVPSVRQLLRRKLPEFMVPSAFVVLDALPLTPNGKVDRQRLPAPEPARVATAAVARPTNDLERSIVGVLQDLLGVAEVGIDDNFFDVGINSLLMVQASVRLRTVIDRPVPLVQMFQYPTARALAAALTATTGADDAVVKQSQDRAQQRRDALQRRRGVRVER